MLGRVLKDDRCRQVVFIGTAWRRFEVFAQHEDRAGQKRLLAKSTALPLPHFLHEVKHQPASLVIKRHPASTDTHPDPHERHHLPTNQGICQLDGPSSPGNIMIRDVEPVYDSTKLPLGPLSTSNRKVTFDTILTTPVVVKMESYRSHILRVERENERTQEIDEHQASSDIPRNRAGQRVDLSVKVNKDLRLKMSSEKWCSNHQLKGLCPYKTCDFKHDLLDDEGKSALLSLARGNPCRNGNSCNEKDCFAGHHCPYDPCKKGRECSFAKQRPAMHFHDKQIVDFVNSRARLGSSRLIIWENWR